ncbi:TPA: hypothetical protein ACPZQN_004485 [Yersinia enterocolitica]|uniref:hypothetical protein n=1 Tax=Enterobacterales TaxID=91347 RepID=UPI0021E89638|nr:hypothetical protein [Yersinia enterocolitica]HDX8709367.1 hypothetical protein [Klebsiella michiganensis]EKN4844645.1 hypothetical protein [Yersinia enterocolitica]EKN5044253.1 hypothetical protein [Yersinia enterocolitica]UYJ87136.1 hypothetical protein N4W04_10910 [Yersinia enterocolitica]UYK12868.1 hypothetical protein N4224_13015 [Yersinia enterocolitica]
MNRDTDRLSDVLTEMSAKALVTWMTHSALQDIPREVLLVRGNDFVYALHANFVLLRDVLSETLEDIEQQSHDLEERLDSLEQRLQMLKTETDHLY